MLMITIVFLCLSAVIQIVLIGLMFVPKGVGYYTPIVLSAIVNVMQGTAMGVLLTTWFDTDAESALWFTSNILIGLSLATSLTFTINHVIPSKDEVTQDKLSYGPTEQAPAPQPPVQQTAPPANNTLPPQRRYNPVTETSSSGTIPNPYVGDIPAQSRPVRVGGRQNFGQ